MTTAPTECFPSEEDLRPRIDPETGIDLSLIEDNLRLTPWERLQANDDAINFIDTTKPAIRIQNHAMSGRTMSDHTIATKPYSSFSAYQTTGLSADVLLVEVLHNSIKGAAQTKAAWLASWETFLAAMDTASRDIIVYIGYPGNYDWATDGTMDDWIGSLYPLLEARQINMVDLREIFTASWTTGEAQDLMYDNDHPNKRGLALYGAKMAKDLLWATDYFV